MLLNIIYNWEYTLTFKMAVLTFNHIKLFKTDINIMISKPYERHIGN